MSKNIPVEGLAGTKPKNVREHSKMLREKSMKGYLGWIMKLFPALAKKLDPSLNPPTRSLYVPVDPQCPSSRVGFYIISTLICPVALHILQVLQCEDDGMR